ncbi:hypothetical protein V8C44DRAFT_311511 [Trichoderma aethiopicum]
MFPGVFQPLSFMAPLSFVLSRLQPCELAKREPRGMHSIRGLLPAYALGIFVCTILPLQCILTSRIPCYKDDLMVSSACILLVWSTTTSTWPKERLKSVMPLGGSIGHIPHINDHGFPPSIWSITVSSIRVDYTRMSIRLAYTFPISSPIPAISNAESQRVVPVQGGPFNFNTMCFCTAAPNIPNKLPNTFIYKGSGIASIYGVGGSHTIGPTSQRGFPFGSFPPRRPRVCATNLPNLWPLALRFPELVHLQFDNDSLGICPDARGTSCGRFGSVEQEGRQHAAFRGG